MSRLHILYPEDNKELISSVVLKIDDLEFDLEKLKPQVIEIVQGNHYIVVYGVSFSNVDIGFDNDGINISHDTSEKEWFAGEIFVEEDDVYYLFKTPLFLGLKGKLKKVSKEVFEQKSK